MRDFFDSSWLIACLTEDEPHHNLCRETLNSALNTESAFAAHHSLAEVFSTLTGKKKVCPEQAGELLHHNFSTFKWIGLTAADYWSCIDAAHTLGVRGGALFDLLLLRAAETSEAERIFTLNKRHFMLFAPHLTHCIQGPEGR